MPTRASQSAAMRHVRVLVHVPKLKHVKLVPMAPFPMTKRGIVVAVLRGPLHTKERSVYRAERVNVSVPNSRVVFGICSVVGLFHYNSFRLPPCFQLNFRFLLWQERSRIHSFLLSLHFYFIIDFRYWQRPMRIRVTALCALLRPSTMRLWATVYHALMACIPMAQRPPTMLW